MQDFELEKARQVVSTFLNLYREQRGWINDQMIADRVPHRDVDDQFVRAVMSVLALFGLVMTGQFDRPVYALESIDVLKRPITLGSLLKPFESSMVT